VVAPIVPIPQSPVSYGSAQMHSGNQTQLIDDSNPQWRSEEYRAAIQQLITTSAQFDVFDPYRLQNCDQEHLSGLHKTP
jgi:hypothetical protein